MIDLTGEGRLGPGAVETDNGRATIFSTVVVIVALTVVMESGIWGAINVTELPGAVMSGVVATLCAILLGICIAVMPHVVRPRGVAFDAYGIHFWFGRDWDVLTWQKIAACGIAYELAPEKESLPTSLTDVAVGLAEKQLDKQLEKVFKHKNSRHVALEIFPRWPGAIDRHPLLARFRRPDQEPPPGLVGIRWRMAIPIGTAHTISRGGQAFAGPHWMGWFRRRWTGGLRRSPH